MDATYAVEDKVQEIFYNLLEETVEQKTSFSSIDEYLQHVLPEAEAEMLVCAAQFSMKKGTKMYGYRALKAVKLRQLRGDVDPLENLRFKPTEATRVAYVSCCSNSGVFQQNS